MEFTTESTAWIFSRAVAVLSQTPGTDANKDLVSGGVFYTSYDEQVRHHKLIGPHPFQGVI